MRERELRKKLKRISADLLDGEEKGGYDVRKEETINGLLELEVPERTRGSRWEFIFSQMKMMKKRMWLFHAFWLVGVIWVMRRGYMETMGEQAYVMAAVAAPVLAVMSVEQISHIYYKSMLEIEFATKYSLKGVVLLRMSVLGVFDMMILSAGMLCFHWYMKLPFLRIMLYGFTPFLIMCLGCLKLMRHYSGEKLRVGSIALAIMLVMMAYIGRMDWIGIYKESRLLIWLYVWMAAVAALSYEMKKMSKQLGIFEQLYLV